MGYVKDYFISEPNDFNEEYFYMREDEYYDALDAMSAAEEARLEDEYNVVELMHAIAVLQECAEETGISCEKAVAALNKFIEEYEDTIELD
jgi:hypothetical protein